MDEDADPQKGMRRRAAAGAEVESLEGMRSWIGCGLKKELGEMMKRRKKRNKKILRVLRNVGCWRW